MPRTKTTITSERARELGRKGRAAVDIDPVTKRFRRRDAPATEAPPVADTPPAAEPPAAEPPTAEPPAPGFRMARSIFGRRRRA